MWNDGNFNSWYQARTKAADSVRMDPKVVSCLERRIRDPLLRALVLDRWRSPTYPRQRVTTKSQFEGLYRRKYCISLTSVAEGSACLSVNNKHTETCKIARPVWNLCFSFLHRCRCDFRGILKMTRDQRFFNDRKCFWSNIRTENCAEPMQHPKWKRITWHHNIRSRENEINHHRVYRFGWNFNEIFPTIEIYNPIYSVWLTKTKIPVEEARTAHRKKGNAQTWNKTPTNWYE